MKTYTPEEVRIDGNTCIAHLSINQDDLVSAPLWWQEKGLSQTASGYGRRLTTSRKISWLSPGAKTPRLRRIYCTCFSNVGSCWFMSPVVVGGPTVRIYVN